MNNFKNIQPDDPILTAFALGEIDDENERMALQEIIETNPELAEAVEEIRSTASLLGQAFAEESRATEDPKPMLFSENTEEPTSHDQKKTIRFPVWIGLIAAAVVALMIGIVSFTPKEKKVVQTAEMQFQPPEGVIGTMPADRESSKFRSDTRKSDINMKHALQQSQQLTVDGDLGLLEESEIGISTDAFRTSEAFMVAKESDSSSISAGQNTLVQTMPAAPEKLKVGYDEVSPEPVAGISVVQDHPATRRALVADGVAGDLSDETISARMRPEPSVATQAQSKAHVATESRLDDESDTLALGENLRSPDTSSRFSFLEIESKKESPEKVKERFAEMEVGPTPSATVMGETKKIKINNGQLNIQPVAVNFYGYAVAGEVIEPVPPPSTPGYRQQGEPSNTEGYEEITDNAFVSPVVEPLSTFSIDVDTASYANVRRFINQGKLPLPDAVRIEELINYFPYGYAAPGLEDKHPIAIHLDAAPARWAPKHQLVRIGLKAREVDWKDRPASNLVFLLDVSGSMNRPNKLPLVKEALGKLIRRLDERDRVAIVVYAGASGLVLPATTANNTETILHALDNLKAGGSTNGGQGIQLAYKTAKENFLSEGNNRIILCTDGDFNVGTTDKGQLTDVVAAEAKDGVYLTVLGFGMGNLKDDMLETLSNKGNGSYGYIDSAKEARKVFVEQATGTLLTVAKDVKIQVEFNPQYIGAYRLIGYENRKLAAQDFNDDKKDAGEVGAGHTVTALYEIIPVGQKTGVPSVDPLKYQLAAMADATDVEEEKGLEISSELLTAKLRYKLPNSDRSTKLEQPLNANAVQDRFKDASVDFRFAAAVAEFGMVLRNSPYKELSNLVQAKNTAEDALGIDPGGHRGDFVDLVEKAISITSEE